MKILVPIKRVVESNARPRPTSDGTSVDTTGLKFEINWFDQIALEEAVRLREKGLPAEIVAVSVGTAESEEIFGKALAMGADKAVLLETGNALDASGVAKALAEFARAEAFDLILMGKQATDGDENQVAQRLAAILDLPQATNAAKIEVNGNAVTVVRETDEGEETLRLPLPAIVTADLRLNEPRYLPIPAIIKAKSKPRERRAASVVDPRVTTVAVRRPPERGAGQRVGTADELFAAIVAKGAL